MPQHAAEVKAEGLARGLYNGIAPLDARSMRRWLLRGCRGDDSLFGRG
ncbi:MAG: hypothetical protein OXM03_00030 [Chloroflexota bacterium]|nr:hypothetical protein [Chloroflexota bacterium]